jgi:SAM-dependent methyltransferase
MLNLSEWYQSAVGRYVVDWELDTIDDAVADVFGFHAVQFGSAGIDFLRANRIPLRLRLDMPRSGVEIGGRFTELPLASASIDLVVLPHVLEFSAEPHQILREVERVLMPEGQVVISGFNPFSLWGLKRQRRRSSEFPWRGDFISLLRLKDWLKLLGLELNGGSFGRYVPPVAQEKWLHRWSFLEAAGGRWWPFAGAIYVVRARKRVNGMRLVAPPWRSVEARRRRLAVVAQRDDVPARRGAARRDSQ